MSSAALRTDELVPISKFGRNISEYVDTVKTGKVEKWVVVKNNMAEAVLLNIHVFEEMVQLLSDLLEEEALKVEIKKRMADPTNLKNLTSLKYLLKDMESKKY